MSGLDDDNSDEEKIEGFALRKMLAQRIFRQRLPTEEGRASLTTSAAQPLSLRWNYAVHLMMQQHPDLSREQAVQKFKGLPNWQDNICFIPEINWVPELAHEMLQVLMAIEYPDDAIYTFSSEFEYLWPLLGTPEARQKTTEDPEGAAVVAYQAWLEKQNATTGTA